MSLHLATSPADEPDLLSLIADEHTTLGKPLADAFRAACWAEAQAHDGWVNPNRVRARLLDHPSYEPRQYAALWAPAAGRDGYLRVHRDALVPIVGVGSKGNGNKSVPMRRWVA